MSSLRSNNAVMVSGRLLQVFLWIKAMVISTVLWGSCLAFILFGIGLPWTSWVAVNLVVIATGVGIGYLAFLYDRWIWRLMKKASAVFFSRPLPNPVAGLENHGRTLPVASPAEIKE